VFDNGTPVSVDSGVYIHHIISTNKRKTDAAFISLCDTRGNVSEVKRPIETKPSSFLGGGDDNANLPTTYTTPDGLFNSGYWLGQNDTIGGLTELVHYRDTQRVVYALYDVEYEHSKANIDTREAMISVHGCSMHGPLASTTSATNTTSGKFVFFEAGTILNASTLF
jgi:hypothetical protein